MFFKALLLYILVDTSRIQEYFKILGTLKIQKMLALLALFGFLFSPGLFRNLKKNLATSQAKILMFLVFWMILSVPFSVWPGASFIYLTESLWKSLLMCFLMLSYGFSQERLKQIILTYFFGTIIFGALGIWLKDINALGIDTSYDRNEFAMQFVIALPLAFWHARSSEGISRVCSFLLCLITPILIIASQSRGAFLGIVAVLIVLLEQSRRLSVKSLLLGLFIVTFFFCLIYFVGGSMYLERLQTLINPSEDYNITSEVGRLAVWKRGLALMSSNPLLGVGINGFVFAEGLATQTTGFNIKWSAAHNSFLQIGVELGIPGLIAYLAIIYIILRNARLQILAERVNVISTQYNSNMKRAIIVSWIGFFVSGFFLSMAMSQVFWFLFAISTILLKLNLIQQGPEDKGKNESLRDFH